MKGKVKIRFLSDQQKKDPLERVAQEGFNLSHLLNNYLLQGWDCSSFQRLVEISSVFLFHMNQPLVSSWRLPGALSRARVGRLTVRQVETKKRELKKRKDNLPERMTTLTSFSSLEISELEVKGLILSLFQVILVADGSNYLSHFFGTISHGNLKEITSTSFHQSLIQSSFVNY